MIKVAIIEDERKMASTINELLRRHFIEDIEVMGIAHNVKSGTDLIRNTKPDLVLLDITMPDGDGFKLLEDIQPVDFMVIFITAYSQYALNAFKVNAVDFIMKPIDETDFKRAIEKAKTMHFKEIRRKQDLRKTNSFSRIQLEKRIFLHTMEIIKMVYLNEIIFCKAEGGYTSFCLHGDESFQVSHTIKKYDDMLLPFGFFRTHKSYIINLEEMDRYDKRSGGEVVMKNGSRIPVSFRKKDELVRIFKD